MTDKVQFEMTLTSPEFAKILGASGLLSPKAVQDIVENDKGKPKEVKPDPSFMSLFRPLAAVEAVSEATRGILRNSNVANNYLGNMGKMFGAALDLLLIPFLPIFNLIMMGVSKLIQWLVSSGVLDQIRDNVLGVIDWVKGLINAVKEGPKALFSHLLSGIKDAIGSVLRDPLAGIATALAALAAGNMAIGAVSSLLGFIPGGRTAARMGGRGAAARAGLGAANAGMPWALRAGMAATAIGGTALAAGGLYGLATDDEKTDTGSRLGRAAKWGMFGAGAGALIGGGLPGAVLGGGIGFAAGGIAELVDSQNGWMNHKGDPRGGVHNETTNTNNYTINVSAGADKQEVADAARKEIERIERESYMRRR